MLRKTSFFILITIVFAFSCGQKQAKPAVETPAEKKIKAADFSADSAMVFLEKQIAFGPRIPNTSAHEKCALWLEHKLKSYCKDVKIQKFTSKTYNGRMLNLTNLIASFNPDTANRILLLTHWDTRPFADNDPDESKRKLTFDGANDGGSGTAVLLEIARQLSLKNPGVGIDILLEDGEDYGAPMSESSQIEDDWCLGTQYWAKFPHTMGYTAHFGILLDMVGAADAVFYKEGASMYFAPDVVQKVWNVASEIGYGQYFSAETSQPITDDHVYVNQIRQFPCIDIIQHDPATPSGFYKNWHTLNDNMSGISKKTLEAVGKTVLTAALAQ
jgi:hypothetical protein